MALFWRIWAAVTLANVVIVAIFVGLATLKFANINSDLAGERLLVLAGRTAAPFESAAKIGLPLSTVRNADALLEQARQTDDAIRAIHVFDAVGQIVHSTVSPAPGKIPAIAVAARAAAGHEPWHRETGEGFLISIDIAALDGGSAGGILIVYSSSGIVTRAWAMAAKLSVAAVVVLLFAAALSALLLRLGLRPQIRLFETIDSALTGFEHRAWRSAAGARSTKVDDDNAGELPALLGESEAHYKAAGRTIANAGDDAA